MAPAPEARLRLFVALELPAGVRASLAAWADAAAPAGVRRVPAENLHVTLAFLGARSAEDASGAGAVLASVVRPVGALRTAGALWLPPRRPGVLAVALAHSDALVDLHRDLGAALAGAIGFGPERRRGFRPHVTVARARRGAVVPAPAAALEPPALEFAAEALTLFRSHTGPAGARYEALASVGVGGAVS